MRQSVLYVAAGLLLHITLAAAASWGYSGATGPANWYINYPACDDQSQSPIDITTTTYEALGNFTFSGYDTAPSTMTLLNNGHTIQVTPAGTTITVSGGGLAGTRQVEQLHFHHGSTDSQGSEHTINGAMYPMEMHIVHRIPSMSLGDAANVTQGLAVLGVFFEIQAANNTVFDDLVAKLPNVVANGATTSITAFAMESLLPSDLSAFYRYNGSLTTPTCYESVEWTVFRNTLKISAVQLAEFRKVQFTDGTLMVDNWRPVMPLNGRTVYSTFMDSAAGTPKPVFLLVALITAATAVFQRV